MHRIIKVLSIIIVLSIMSETLAAAADLTESGYELAYTINADGKSVTVTGFETEPEGDYDLVIPRKVIIDGNSYIVTDIADGTLTSDGRGVAESIFGGKRENSTNIYETRLKSVTFPETLKTIGRGAFYACSSLTELNIPSSVVKIGEQSFRLCTAIEKMTMLSDNLTEIGTWAFGDLESLGGVVYIPGNADLKSGVTFQTSVRGRAGHYAQIIMGEGRAKMPNSLFWNGSWVDTVVFPGTLEEGNIESFTQDNMPRLRDVYILSESFKWTKNLAISSGSKNEGGIPTKWHVKNDSVKESLTVNGVAEENIVVEEENTVVFCENEENYSINTVSEDSVVLYEPSRDGYKFCYWYDGENSYNAGETYTLNQSKVLSAVWQRLNEKDTVLYKKVKSGGTRAEFDKASVGRILCPELAGQTQSVVLTDETGSQETVEAEFDSDGLWINYGNDSEYTAVDVPSAPGYTLLIGTDGIIEAEIGLKEPTVIAVPKINGNINQDDFSWTSSDSSVAKVSGGEITGCKSGNAVISAEYEGVKFDINITVTGEIALAKRNGTEAEYIAEKKPIVDAVINAINNKDKQGLISILNSTSEIKLSDIRDIDTEDYEQADESVMNEFAERMMTYRNIEVKEIDDFLTFGDILAKEFAVGRLNHLADTAQIKAVLDENNNYYGLPLDNTYYMEYPNETLEYFKNYTAINLEGLTGDFKEAYVLAAFCATPVYSAAASVIEGCAKEIGYNISHYNAIKGAVFSKALIEARSNIKTLEQLKQYIDGYKNPPVYGGGGSGGGGGSSGQKASSSSAGVPYMSDITVHIQEPVADTVPLFKDFDNDRWSHDAVAYLVAKDVIKGYDDSRFLPEKKITRAEFIKMISTAFNLLPEEENTASDEIKFADVSESDWFYPYVRGASAAKVVAGDERGLFNPNAEITRQEAAAIIYRITAIQPVEAVKSLSVNITDEVMIDEWAYTSVQKLLKM